MTRKIAVAVFVAACGIGCDGDRDVKPANVRPAPAEPRERLQSVAEPIAAPDAAPADAAGVVEVTAQKLFADYDANEVSADDKYRDKPLRVTGIIRRIAKSITDDAYLELATASEWHAVYATLADAREAAKLKRGEKVVVLCRGTGKTVEPTADRCTIEHVYEWVPK